MTMPGFGPVFRLAYPLMLLLLLVWGVLDWQRAVSSQLAYEVSLLFLILAAAATFPLGPLLLAVLSLVWGLVPGLRSPGLSELLLIWLPCAVGGMLQWYLVVPMLRRWLKQRARRA